MKTIYEFKKGDEIVRIQPSKQFGDRSYMGEKLIFVGIANGQIYLQSDSDFRKAMFGDKLIDLSLDIWDEGWAFYVNPKKLLEGFESKISNEIIQEQINNAIENENYELAAKLKLKLT